MLILPLPRARGRGLIYNTSCQFSRERLFPWSHLPFRLCLQVDPPSPPSPGVGGNAPHPWRALVIIKNANTGIDSGIQATLTPSPPHAPVANPYVVFLKPNHKRLTMLLARNPEVYTGRGLLEVYSAEQIGVRAE